MQDGEFLSDDDDDDDDEDNNNYVSNKNYHEGDHKDNPKDIQKEDNEFLFL